MSVRVKVCESCGETFRASQETAENECASCSRERA